MRAVLALLPAAMQGLVPPRSAGFELHRAGSMRADPARRRITGTSVRVASGRCLRSRLDEDDDAPTAADVVDAPTSDADFGGAVINAVTAVLGVAVAISTVCNLAGYGFMQTDEGLYSGRSSRRGCATSSTRRRGERRGSPWGYL